MVRPNLLLFTPDQLRADALGCFGSPVAQTTGGASTTFRLYEPHHVDHIDLQYEESGWQGR